MRPAEWIIIRSFLFHVHVVGNQHYAKLFLGAFIGQPLLETRRSIDIFMQLDRLINRKSRLKIFKKKTIRKIINYLDRNQFESQQKSIKTKMLLRCARDLQLENCNNEDLRKIYM